MQRFTLALAGLLALIPAPFAHANGATGTSATTRVPAALAVTRRLGAPPAGVTELKFADMFKLPVGPKGLEPTDRLRALDGKRVRIVGYMVQQELPVGGSFMLSPLPASAGDEDESLADDLPASTIIVQLPNGPGTIVPDLHGLIRVTGVLHVGATEVARTERVAAARVTLDARTERALLRLAREAAARKKAR